MYLSLYGYFVIDVYVDNDQEPFVTTLSKGGALFRLRHSSMLLAM